MRLVYNLRMNSNLPPVILTHAGAFHADEIVAIALLERFYLTAPLVVSQGLSHAQIQDIVAERTRPTPPVRYLADGTEDQRQPVWIIRSRDPKLLRQAQSNSKVFVIDVGGQLDEAALNFDHHQASMTRVWDNGTPLSSTGLIWKWLRQHNHLSELSEAVLDDIEQSLIEPLDAHDNGVRISKYGQVVEGFNRPREEDPNIQLAQFAKALDFCRNVVDNSIYSSIQRVAAIDILTRAWEKFDAQGKPYVLLEEPLPCSNGTELLQKISSEKALMLGIPGAGNRYSLVSLPIGEDRFASICPVPESWRGRMDFTVDLGSAHPTRVVFAHKTGFMCVIEGTASQAVPVVEYIVANNSAPTPPRHRP